MTRWRSLPWALAFCLSFVPICDAAAAEASELEAYARAWATGGDGARGGAGAEGEWLRGFGPIDVACTIEIDRVGLDGSGAPPGLTWVFADGSRLAVDAGAESAAAAAARFAARPAVCEYRPGGGGDGRDCPDVALLMVASSPAYLLRLWPLLLNKLLYATDAGLRPFVWVGDLQRSSGRARACRVKKRRRRAAGPRLLLLTERWRGTRGRQYGAFDDGRVSNHHIKIVATLAALGEPSIRGAYYADLDTSVAHPWVVGGDVLDEHARGESDVTFNYDAPSGPAKVAAFRWQVRSSHFYARDSVAGRAFFARWFANRCTFKDQFSLFHTILELADDAGCIDYRGEVWSELTYNEALHGSKHDLARRLPGVALDCARVDARCPDWTFRKRGATCSRHATPNLIDALYHRSLAGHRDAQVFAFDGGNITVANACFTTRGTPLENTTRRATPGGDKMMVKVIAPPEREMSAWIGCSVMASLSTFSRSWISRQECEADGAAAVVQRKLA
ncbi:10-hydroxy-9-(phosphonooxy)octadecanoate phosphatase [Aureococcus anophagefferens]|nr:10-hydroxy-9-(phosphonooxy)octadecanoate phosphatase [Aureococcus anophagefferens]